MWTLGHQQWDSWLRERLWVGKHHAGPLAALLPLSALTTPCSHGTGPRGQRQTDLKPTGLQTNLTWCTQPWRSLKPGQCTYIPRFLPFLRKAGSSGGVHSSSSQGSPQNPSSSWLPLDRQSAATMKQAFHCLCDLFLPLSTYHHNMT